SHPGASIGVFSLCGLTQTIVFRSASMLACLCPRTSLSAADRYISVRPQTSVTSMKTTRILAALLACVGIARAALPSIDTQPANSTNCVGSAASFTVAASSDSSTNYQWYFADNTSTNAITDAT